MAFAADQSRAATMAVDSTVDARDDDPGDGACQTAPGGPCTLRAAFEEAQGNGNADVDLINVPAGNFDLTLGEQLIIAFSGTVKVAGAGPEATTIRQTGPDRVINVSATGGTPSFVGMTIRGGRLPADAGSHTGAGINSVLGIKLDRVVLYDNQAAGESYGGGLYATGPEISIQRTRIAGNRGGLVGGVSLQSDEVLISDSVIENNTGVADHATGGLSVLATSGDGGLITNTVIAGNRAPAGTVGGIGGGGLVGAGADFVVERSLIHDNSSVGSGGWVLGGSQQAVIRNTTFSGNRGGSSSGAAGAMLKQFGSGPPVSMKHVTLTGNSVPGGPGALRDQGGIAFDLEGSVIDGTCQLSPGGTTVDATDVFSDDSCGPASPVPLGLEPLADNGGPTLTHGLMTGSPALGRVAAGCLPTDQRGAARIPVGCDAGAYEAGSEPPPSTSGAPPAPDVDGDGIEDLDDACPDRPGSEADGCPADRDGDGIEDLDDACPDQPGTGTDGCPTGGVEEPGPGPDARAVASFNVHRALLRRGRIELAGRLSPATGGTVHIALRGRGKRQVARFRTQADPERFRLRRRLPKRLRRVSSLRVLLSHAGSDSAAPAKAGLLAGRRPPRLTLRKLKLDRVAGRLVAGGRIARKARGKVTVALLPASVGAAPVIKEKAPIRRGGRWQLSRRLPGLAPAHRRLVVIYRGSRVRRLSGARFTRGLPG